MALALSVETETEQYRQNLRGNLFPVETVPNQDSVRAKILFAMRGFKIFTAKAPFLMKLLEDM